MEYEKLIEKAKEIKANIVVYVNAEIGGVGSAGHAVKFSPKEISRKKINIVKKLNDEYVDVSGEFNSFDFNNVDPKTKNWTKTEKSFVADTLFSNLIFEKVIPNTLLEADIYLKAY